MGVIGDIAGLFGTDSARDEYRKGINAQKAAGNMAAAEAKQYYDDLAAQYGPEAASYMADVSAWRERASAPQRELTAFNQDIDVSKYMDPAVAYRQEQARKAIDQSAAARGGGMFSMGGAQAKALQDRSSQIASDEWSKAYGRGSQERAFDYQEMLNRYNAGVSADQRALQNLQGLMAQSGTARQNMLGAQGAGVEANLSNIINQGNLDAQKYQMQGDANKAMWQGAGNLLDSGIKAGTSYYTGGMTGLFSGGGL